MQNFKNSATSSFVRDNNNNNKTTSKSIVRTGSTKNLNTVVLLSKLKKENNGVLVKGKSMALFSQKESAKLSARNKLLTN